MKWFLCVFLCIPLSQGKFFFHRRRFNQQYIFKMFSKFVYRRKTFYTKKKIKNKFGHDSIESSSSIPAQSCSKYIDLVIVVESSNITSYQDKQTTTWHPAIQMFLTSLLDGMTLGAEFFRVAVVLYSSSIDDVMTFTVDREFAQHAVTFLRPNFGGANLHTGLEEMNRLYQYYSRPGATKRALLVTGSHIGDSSSTFAEVWQARIMNVDLLAIGFGGNELEHELKQMASDFVVTISDIGMLYALVTRALERICIGKFHISPCFLFKCFILQPFCQPFAEG